MADLTTTTEPSVSAWIVKRTSNAPRYSVRIDVGVDHSRRNRREPLGRRTGRWWQRLRGGPYPSHPLGPRRRHDPFRPLADRRTVRAARRPRLDRADRPVVRLPWDEFLRILPLLGVPDPGAVPLIDDVVYTRDLLELAVRDDLLGPPVAPMS